MLDRPCACTFVRVVMARRFEDIPVPGSTVRSDDPYDLVFAIVTLVNRTIF